MSLVLRPYQESFIDRVCVALRDYRAVLGVSPTGSGKTRMACAIIERALRAGYAVIFLAHLDSLVEDTFERLVEAGVRVGYIQAGRAEDPEALVQVASVQTVAVRGLRPFGDGRKLLIIADEAHRSIARMWATILAAYPDAGLLGLTATPQRGDGRALGDVYDVIVEGPSPAELLADGFLSPVDVRHPDHQTTSLSRDPVEAYLDLPLDTNGGRPRSIFFARNVAHAEQLAGQLVEAGIPTATIVGETKRADRRAIRSKLVSGELRAVVGVSVFLEGWDCPALEVVVLARPFSVWGAWLQALGRGRRPCPATGKTWCIVLDLHGSIWEFAPPDERLRFSLSGEPMTLAEPLPAVMRCKQCFATFRPAKRCPRCGASTRGAAKIPRVMSRQERLISLEGLPRSERDRRFCEAIARKGAPKMGHEAAWNWAKRVFFERFGRRPEVHG
jgi:superfamily II DNA or RNA helicase